METIQLDKYRNTNQFCGILECGFSFVHAELKRIEYR